MPSKSKQQQKFMGIVRSIQKGEAPAGKFSKAAQKAAKSMEKGSVKKYAKTKHDDLPKKVSESTKAELYKMYSKAMKMMPGSSNQKELEKKISALRKKLGMNEERDYKAEYKKFQSSTKSKKYRAELNKYNRKKGTYGNGDGKDASHKGGKIVGFESQSKNRGRAEKSRLKKEVKLNENPAAIAAATAMTKIKMKNPKTGKENSAVSALKDKDNPNHKKAKGIFAKLKDRFSKKKDDKKAAPKKQSKSDVDFYKRQYTGESVNEDDLGLTYKKGKTVKVTHKKSGKELVIVDKPNVRKEYEKIGFYAESVDEGTTQKFKSAIIDKAIKVAKSMGGNMTGAVKKIEKMEKGLSKNGRVEYALQQANESVNEAGNEDRKWSMYVDDKKIKTYKSKRAAVIAYNKFMKDTDNWKEVSIKLESVNEAGTKSIDGEELLKYLQKRFKMSRKQAIASMKKHNMDVSSIKKESVKEAKSKTMTTIGSIIGKKQAQKIDGVLVDMQTALVIMKVWNALGSSNRSKFEKLPIKKMANVAWKLMK